MGDVVRQMQADRGPEWTARRQAVSTILRWRIAWRGRWASCRGGGTNSPVQRDLARFGLFADQALRLGLFRQQTEQVVREVQVLARRQDAACRPATLLVKQVQTDQNVS